MVYNKFSNIVEREWLITSEYRPYVLLHDYIIMPNHFHGIVEITNNEGVARNAPTVKNAYSAISPRDGTLSVIIRAFKSAVSKSIHITDEMIVWQRNYYDHIIRNNEDYNRIAEYIVNNPKQWKEDRF
jgi:REP element-mobilizing transposase RayT